MDWQVLGQLIVNGIAFAMGNVATYVIVLYHQMKPLGMQTLLGQVTILFVNVFRMGYVAFTIATSLGVLFSTRDRPNDTLSILVTIARKN